MQRLIRKAVLSALVLGLYACTEPRESAPAMKAPASVPRDQLVLLEPAALPKGPLQCVPYARLASGLPIRGDAWTWWSAADGRYARGKEPRPGAVLVFMKTRRLPLGHLSVVSRVVHRREILVTHANWGAGSETRGRVASNVRVIDISPANDWSELRVWNGGSFGRIYPAQGFIYAVPIGT